MKKKEFMELSLAETQSVIDKALKEYKGETTILKSAGDKSDYKRLRESDQEYEKMIEEKKVIDY